MFGLVYGVIFIQDACHFYDHDLSDSVIRKEGYKEKLKNVIFLEKNSNSELLSSKGQVNLNQLCNNNLD